MLPYGPPFTLPSWGLLPEWLQGRDLQIQIADIDVGLLFIFAITALGVYGVVLAGWAANNKYALLGRPALLGPDVLLRAGPGPVAGWA